MCLVTEMVYLSDQSRLGRRDEGLCLAVKTPVHGELLETEFSGALYGLGRWCKYLMAPNGFTDRELSRNHHVPE